MPDLFYNRKPLVYVPDPFEVALGNAGAALAAASADAGAGGSDDGETNQAAILFHVLNQTTVPCATFEGSRRGGTYRLCGFAEFVDPSSPPKFYHFISYAGSLISCYYGTNNACSGPITSGFKTQFSGVCERQAVLDGGSYDCDIVQQGVILDQSVVGACSGFSGGTPADYCGSGIALGPLFNVTGVTTKTSDTSTGAGCFSGLGGDSWNTVGSASATLSSEDTEADAIARLVSTSAWSAYSSTTQPLARWQTMRSGNSGVYFEARYQGTAAVPDGVTRFVKIGIFRRLFGVGSYAQVATQFLPVLGGPGDVGSFSADVPNIPGYETYAQCLAP